MLLARTPFFPHSPASDFVNMITPDFAALYADWGWGVFEIRPDMEAVLMMLPRSCLSIILPAFAQTATGVADFPRSVRAASSRWSNDLDWPEAPISDNFLRATSLTFALAWF